MDERAAEDEATNNSSVPIGETKQERVSIVPWAILSSAMSSNTTSAAIQHRAQEYSKPEA